MHSAEFSVEDEWMRQYRSSLKSLVQQFSHVPEMEAAGRHIQKVPPPVLLLLIAQSPRVAAEMVISFQMLDANVSLCVTDGVQSDSVSQLEVDAELISRWEKEFLQERLQELLRAAAEEDEDDSEKQVQKHS